MIHATRSEFILTKNLGEIRYLSIAIGPTYIIRATLPTNNHILIHCDLKGNILYEQSLPADLSVIEMLSERYLVYFYEDLNMIVCLDLKHKKQHFIPHAFNMVKYHTDMHVFKKTNYFCLVEIAREVDNSMILTYYHPESKVLVHTYETKPGDYNDDCELIAVNTRNKVCWYMEKGNYDLEFTTYDIEDNIQGKLTHYKFHNNVPIDVRITRSSKNKIASFSLTEMIELRRNIYLFACKHQNDQMVFLMNTEAEETIRLAGYKFEGALLQNCSWNISKDWTIFFSEHKCSSERGQYQFTAYVIDNAKTDIIVSQTMQIGRHGFFCSFIKSSFEVFYVSNNRDGKKECQVTCNSYEYMTHLEWLVRNDTKTVVVFFALQLFEEFDEDLLKQITEVIEVSNYSDSDQLT